MPFPMSPPVVVLSFPLLVCYFTLLEIKTWHYRTKVEKAKLFLAEGVRVRLKRLGGGLEGDKLCYLEDTNGKNPTISNEVSWPGVAEGTFTSLMDWAEFWWHTCRPRPVFGCPAWVRLSPHCPLCPSSSSVDINQEDVYTQWVSSFTTSIH